MPKRIERGPAVAREQRVEDHQVRSRRNEILERNATRDREQIEAVARGNHGQDVDQHEAQPEDGNRHAEQHAAHR